MAVGSSHSKINIALPPPPSHDGGYEQKVGQLRTALVIEQAAGLAVLVTADQVRLHRLPVTVAEAVYAGPRFQILPLLHVLQGDGELFIIAVSSNECRLLSATRDNVSQIDADLPDSIQAAPDNRHIKAFGMHSFNVKPRSQDSTVAHGHVEADDEELLLRYFREIDEAVGDVIEQPDTPLIFAGDDSLFAHYRERRFAW